MTESNAEPKPYGFGSEKPERLAGMEATWDPGTRSILESLGIQPGWRCLEVGAGGGSVAAWLAEQVAPSGSVLATDIDTANLDGLAGPILTVSRHDIARDELPAGSFDLVHERSVVSWLGATDAWDRLVDAVAPGGWLLVEDFDFAVGGALDDTSPVAKAYEGVLRQIESVGYDRHYGRTLTKRLADSGLEQIGGQGRSYVIRGGSPGTWFDRFSVAALRDRLLAGGVVTEAELDETLGYFDDPDSYVLTPIMYAAWGRKPS